MTVVVRLLQLLDTLLTIVHLIGALLLLGLAVVIACWLLWWAGRLLTVPVGLSVSVASRLRGRPTPWFWWW